MAVIGKRQALAVLVVIGLLTFLYFRSQGVDLDRHSQTISQLRELKRLIPDVRQNVLLVHVGKLNHYDSLVANLANMRTGISGLKKEGPGIYGNDDSKIDLSIDDFEDLTDNLTQLVEDFKTNYSVFRNSSAYLPYFASEIQNGINQEGASEVMTADIAEIRLALLQYQLTGSSTAKGRLASRMEHLVKTARQSSAELAGKIDQLKKHVNIVLTSKEKLELNLEEIFSLPIESSIDIIFSNYITNFDDMLINAQIYRTILYIFSLILIIYIGYVFIVLRRTAVALRRSNETLEERVDARTAELQKLNDQKDRFFAIIAHDLKSPFNALLGFSHILATQIERLKPDQVAEYGSLVHRSADQAFKLLEDLLDWSRLQLDRIEFEPEPIDLGELIKTNLARYEPMAAAKSIRIDGDTMRELRVHADAHMVDTILRNLISNAIKFTAERGTITVTARQSGDWAEVAVTDTGVGMTADKVAGLFRLEEATSTNGTGGETGTGLGLQLCKELAEKQGGQIRVESAEGEGSTFRVTLPLHQQ